MQIVDLTVNHHVFIHSAGKDEYLTKLASIEKRIIAMTTKQDVLDAMARERQQIVDAFAAANAAQDVKTQELKDQIKTLQDHIDAGQAVTSADFDELLTATDAIFNGTEPPPLPEPLPVPEEPVP